MRFVDKLKGFSGNLFFYAGTTKKHKKYGRRNFGGLKILLRLIRIPLRFFRRIATEELPETLTRKIPPPKKRDRIKREGQFLCSVPATQPGAPVVAGSVKPLFGLGENLVPAVVEVEEFPTMLTLVKLVRRNCSPQVALRMNDKRQLCQDFVFRSEHKKLCSGFAIDERHFVERALSSALWRVCLTFETVFSAG